jgi:hypothetical protein
MERSVAKPATPEKKGVVRSGKPFPVRRWVILSDDPALSSRLSSAADLCQRQISSAGQSPWELAFCRWPIHGSGSWTRWLARILAVNPPLGIVFSSPGARCEGSGAEQRAKYAAEIEDFLQFTQLDWDLA